MSSPKSPVNFYYFAPEARAQLLEFVTHVLNLEGQVSVVFAADGTATVSTPGYAESLRAGAQSNG